MNAFMASKKMVALLLVLAATACGGSDDGAENAAGEPGGSSTSPGETTAGPGTGGTSAPQYTVSCSGDVKLASLAVITNVAPRCAGAAPDSGTFGCGESCEAQDVTFTYALPAHRCGATNVWTWDGTSCIAHPTQTNDGAMRCTGVDCPNIFKTEEACTAAHAQCSAK